MKKGILAYLTPFFALLLASIVGYYSVTGLSKLFAGASTAIIILGAVLESVKLLGTAILHVYWKKLSWLVRIYMVIGVISIMGITSAGVYGLLTSAYQTTSNSLKVNNKEVQLVENKKIVYNSKISTLNQQLEFKNNQINNLVNLRTQQEARVDSLLSKNHWTNVKKTQEQIKESSNDIKLLQGDVDVILVDIGNFNDSIAKLEIQILDIQTGSDAATELGPLMYVADLTGRSMDEVINWFMLLLIFVADPFAIVLLIVTTKLWKTEDGDDEAPIVTEPIIIPPVITPEYEQPTELPNEQHVDVTETTSTSTSNTRYINSAQPVNDIVVPDATPITNKVKTKWHGVNPKQAILHNKKGTL